MEAQFLVSGRGGDPMCLPRVRSAGWCSPIPCHLRTAERGIGQLRLSESLQVSSPTANNFCVRGWGRGGSSGGLHADLRGRGERAGAEWGFLAHGLLQHRALPLSVAVLPIKMK